jgi:hypothetical protein
MAENQTAVAATPAKAPKKKPLFKKLAQFQTPDGKIFETQKEATEHLRGYLVDEALAKVVAALPTPVTVQWLKDNEAMITKAYNAAKVERPPVSEETKAKMKAAREKLYGPAKAAQAAPAQVKPAVKAA